MRMASAERQAALFRLAFAHGRWPAWFVMACTSCDGLIDLRVAPEELEAEGPVPEAVTAGALAFMRPNGTQEDAIAAGAAIEDIAAALCLRPAGGEAPAAAALGAALPALEAALAAEAAHVPGSLPITCPHCAAQTRFWFDPFDWISRHAGQALADVHRLASAYGWTEAEIMKLPDARRRAYLAMTGGAQ